MDEKEFVWHRETIDASVEQTLRDLQQVSMLAPFYLAEGTGLALHLGHRRSLDLDFLLGENFNEDSVVQKLQNLTGFTLVAKQPATIYATVRETKVSFITYAYPLLFPFQSFLGTNVADPREIGCMKISAIASRGTKRDFIDLYALSQPYGLEQIVTWFQTKFAQTNYSRVHVLKSLSYFEEAEKEPMPSMLVSLTWKEVKQFFTREAPRLH
jgi:hypothetical protein